MNAAVVTAYGGPEVMQYREMPDPVPGAGEILVKSAGIGINPEDFLERNGSIKVMSPLTFPAIIGLDVSGTVVAIGAGVTGFRIGNRVCGWSYHTYAELVADKATVFAVVPEAMDLVDAAAIPLVGTTGSQLISVAAGVRAGHVVLVSGAAGAVGRCAVYTAKAAGAYVIAGVRRTQLDQARSIGADETVALDHPAAFAAIPTVDVVANTLGGRAATQLLQKVKDRGVFASVTGAPDGSEAFPTLRIVSFRSKQDPAAIARVADAVLSGTLTIPIDRREKLAEAGAAQTAFTTRGNGKILLVP